MADSAAEVIRLDVGQTAKAWQRTVFEIGLVKKVIITEVRVTVLEIEDGRVTMALHQSAEEES